MLKPGRVIAGLVVVVIFVLQVAVCFAEEQDAEIGWEDIFGEIPENATESGYLFVRPGFAHAGSCAKIGIYYILYEDFRDGSVIFHLPDGITAAPHQDSVLITNRNGDTENDSARAFVLEPFHIGNNGRDVHVTGITMDEFGVVALFLEERELPETDYLYFEVTSDADGEGEEKSPTPGIFAPISSMSLKGFQKPDTFNVSPKAPKVGTTQTFTLTYTLADDIEEGWIEFYLPVETPVIPGEDKFSLNDVDRILSEVDVEETDYDELVVRLTGITAQKGDTVTLTLYDKTITDVGVYFVSVVLGIGEEEHSTFEWIDSESYTFFVYSDVDDGWETIRSFAKAVNDRDLETAMELVADDADYADGPEGLSVAFYSMDYFLDVMVSSEGFRFENDESTSSVPLDGVYEVSGTARDYFADITAELYPEEGFTGKRYRSRYFISDNKIHYIEFRWSAEDLDRYEELTSGTIGALMRREDNGQVVVLTCVPGLPSAKAGIKAGDIILAIDGIGVSEMNEHVLGLSEVVHRVRGKPGTKVLLTINRDGEIFDIEVERMMGL